MIRLSAILFILAFAVGAGAKPAQEKPTKKASELRTDIRFSGTDVDGKYQVPGEALATVENEKSLMDLIEPRREFKDRLRKSVTQR
jgi:hypothetical protein